MATVIDSLVLELGIDPKKFTQGQRDALSSLRTFEEQAESQGKRVESQTKRLNSVLTDFKREALTTLGVFFGGMGVKQFTSYITTLDASTARLGKTVNMAAGEMSAWQGMFQQVGGSAESANGALTGLGGEMQRFVLTGQSSMLPVLSRLGISMFDQNKQLKTAGQLWLEIADATKGMKDTEKAAFVGMIPGANQDLINLIIKGRPAMEAYLRAAREAGGTTRDSAAAAEEYQRSLAVLDRSATNLGRTLVTALVPALSAAMDAMVKFIKGPTKEAKDKFQADYAPIAEKHGFDPNADSFWEQLASRAMGLPTKSGRQYKWGDPYVSQSGKPAAGAPATGSIPVKPGAGTASPAVQSIKDALSGVSGIKQVTSMNDAYHMFLGGGHPAGRALDVTIKDPSKSGEVAAQIRSVLAEKGIEATVLDEYKNPSSHATGGHLHIGVGAGMAAKMSAKGAGAPAAALAAAGGAGGAGGAGAGNTTTVTTSIGTVQVNAPQARDADDIAHHIGPALDRVITAGAANVGQE